MRFRLTDELGSNSAEHTVIIRLCHCSSDHGKCDFKSSTKDTTNPTFQIAACECTLGWTGRHCQFNFDGCLTEPCEKFDTNCTDLSPSQHRQQKWPYVCEACPDGYTDEFGGCVDIDECRFNSTVCGSHTCRNLDGSYSCSCNNGYRSPPHDDKFCEDIDECSDRIDGCQHKCENNAGGYSCGCFQGYSIHKDAHTCTQSVSATGCTSLNCDQGCRLDNNTGAPECFCNKGWQMDKDNVCYDINECESPQLNGCVAPSSCENTPGGYRCACPVGTAIFNDPLLCQECLPTTWGPDCSKSCNCQIGSRICSKTEGCICNPGWTGMRCETVINLCELGEHDCSPNETCISYPGGYTCACDYLNVIARCPGDVVTEVPPTTQTVLLPYPGTVYPSESLLTLSLEGSISTDKTSPQYSDILQFFNRLYGNITDFQDVTILNITIKDGLSVIYHQVGYIDPANPREEWDTALVLQQYVNSHLYLELASLNRSIENATYIAIEPTDGSVLGEVPLLEREWSVCYLYDVKQSCENGGWCYIDTAGYPTCGCPSEYWGEYCQYSGVKPWDPIIWVAILVPTLFALTLALCCTCYAIAAAIRSRKRKKEEDETSIAPGGYFSGTFRIPRSLFLSYPPNWREFLHRSEPSQWDESTNETDISERDVIHREPVPNIIDDNIPDETSINSLPMDGLDMTGEPLSSADLMNQLLGGETLIPRPLLELEPTEPFQDADTVSSSYY